MLVSLDKTWPLATHHQLRSAQLLEGEFGLRCPDVQLHSVTLEFPLIQRLSRLVSQTLLAQLKIGLTPNSATMGLTHVRTLRIPRASSH